MLTLFIPCDTGLKLDQSLLRHDFDYQAKLEHDLFGPVLQAVII